MIKSLSNLAVKDLSRDQAVAELQRLAQLISQYDRLYYQLAKPEVSDAEYDQLTQRNIAIEKRFPDLRRADSPSFRVGAPPAQGFRKIKHRTPMLSLDNAFSIDDIAEFLARTRRFLNMPNETAIELVAEPKIDGLSAALHYQDGKLVLGSTRGDGQEGEDVTENLRTIADIPNQITADDLPSALEIRGEVYLGKSDFAALNLKREQAGENIFANPRNSAAGSLRQLDPKLTRQRPLKFFAYYVKSIQGEIATKHYNCMELLQTWGFTTIPKTIICQTLVDIENNYHKLMQQRAELDFDIDGIVYKINDLKLQQRLGTIGRSPRYAIAHKFPAERAQTIVEKIDVQVGRTGVLTPVAYLKPITVGGVVVSRATLHNYDEIKRLNIREGDTVEIQRSGDVIPKVLKVIQTKHAVSYTFPTQCPSCGGEIKKSPDEVAMRCTAGIACPAQAVEQLKHFVSRDAFDIDGLGSRNIEAFYASKLITSPVDIFTLETRDSTSNTPLKRQDGWGVQSAKNLFEAIDRRRKIELHRFIYALGIPQVGQINAKLIAKNYKSLAELRAKMLLAADSESDAKNNLLAIDGIGKSVAEDIISFFNNSYNIDILDKLIGIESEPGLITVLDNIVQTVDDAPLAGKSIVFTGTLEDMSRSEAKAIAERLGAKVVSSVSKNTDIVVVGTDAGSKAKKAKELGLEILDEANWMKFVEG